MAVFDRAIATAQKLIKKYGQLASWKQSTTTANPDTPWLPSETSTFTFYPFICFLPLDKDGREFLATLGKTEVATGSYYGLMGNVPFVPNIKDSVIRDGVPLEIQSIDLLSPNGQKILYTVIFNG